MTELNDSACLCGRTAAAAGVAGGLKFIGAVSRPPDRALRERPPSPNTAGIL